MTGFRLADPLWLLLLLLLPLLAYWRGRSGTRAALRFPSRSLFGPAARPVRFRPGVWLAAFRFLALALLILALSRPQLPKSESREDTRGINVVLALDFSGTMRTRDFLLDGRRVSRSEGLKRISAEFIRSRPNDRLGLVSFDRDAYLAGPLTLDHEWLLERLKREENGTGTAVGSALAVAAQHLQRHTNETRVMILMTDAENISAGPPPDVVAEAVAPLGIRIHVIQLLSPDEATPQNDLSEYLTRAAARTGGEFFRVRNGQHLRAVYRQIDTLEKHKLSDQRTRSYRELFPWLAIPALALLGLELILTHTRWRRLP
jgi:Ca-activated chloride channel family protein